MKIKRTVSYKTVLFYTFILNSEFALGMETASFFTERLAKKKRYSGQPARAPKKLT